jgi:ribosomal protein S18 acetylase RimI-like enzyme
LAYAAGHLSRFFLDPGFSPQFEALYAEWVRKALRDEDSKVFTLSDSRHMLGMVTLSIRDAIGTIGLIAIDRESQGRGLGMRLLKQCEAHYHRLDARTCTVVTQKANIGACLLYQKAGYAIATEQDVWHVWKG